MLDKDQTQTVASGGTAIQAGGAVSVTNIGLSYSDARAVALDVFRDNFYALAGIAAETASARAKEITEDFLSKLEKENPAGILKSNDPDFQYALFTAQREYARCGDKELEGLLVDLLVDRSKQEQRNFLQIVLNESLNTAPKLTEGQLAALALVFLFRHTQRFGIVNHQQFGNYLDEHAAPFISKVPKGRASYQHMEFTGCGAIGITSITLESVLQQTYQGQFQKGFHAADIAHETISTGNHMQFLAACQNDPTKLQVRANNKDLLAKDFELLGTAEATRAEISRLFALGQMADHEVREKCVAIRPYMANLFELWDETEMKHFTLTSVGIAIAHANIKRLVGEFANLSIWIN